MFALPFMRRRGGGGGAASIPPGTYATPQDVANAISQLIGGAPDVTLDTIAEIAARIINDEASLAAVSAAIANKQDKNAKLTALSALALTADKLIYATGANTLATSDLTAFMRSVLAAQDAAGARAAIGAPSTADVAAKQDKVAFTGIDQVPMTTNAAGTTLGPFTLSYTGKQLMAVAPGLAAGTFLYINNATGDVSNTPSTAAGRKVLAFQQLGFPGTYGPYSIVRVSNTTGDVTANAMGTFGSQLVSLNTPPIGSIPYAQTGAGDVNYIASTTFSRTFIGAASAQAARALMGTKAAVLSNFNSNTAVPTNGSPVELLWTTNGALEGFDAAGVALTANPGRVTTAQTTSLALRPTLSLYASGPGDFFVTLELRDATGATIGNENGAPSQGTGAGWKTTNVPFRFGAAGYWSVDLPDIPLKAGGNFAQLRVYITRPADATAVSVSEYQLKMVQQA